MSKKQKRPINEGFVRKEGLDNNTTKIKPDIKPSGQPNTHTKPTPPKERILREGQEPKAPRINPKDYLRTLTEGEVAPDESFIWTHNPDELARMAEGKPEKEKENKKVYCAECVYFPIGVPRKCNKVIFEYDTAIIKMPVYAVMYETNMNNDCSFYEKREKWYIKLWRIFK